MFAIVDKDALDDLDSKPKFKPLYENNKHFIFALPFTPEVWIIDSVEKTNANVRKQYKHEFGIDIASIIGNTEYTKQNCKKPRELAKKKYKVVCQLTAKASCTQSEDIISQRIISLLVSDMSDKDIMLTLAPVFNR